MLRSAIWWNLAFAAVSSAANMYTVLFDRATAGDLEDFVENTLTIPTLAVLNRQLDSRIMRSSCMISWITALTVFYVLGTVWDAVDIVLGRWAKLEAHTISAVADLLTLLMWVQILYLIKYVERADALAPLKDPLLV